MYHWVYGIDGIEVFGNKTLRMLAGSNDACVQRREQFSYSHGMEVNKDNVVWCPLTDTEDPLRNGKKLRELTCRPDLYWARLIRLPSARRCESSNYFFLISIAHEEW